MGGDSNERPMHPATPLRNSRKSQPSAADSNLDTIGGFYEDSDRRSPPIAPPSPGISRLSEQSKEVSNTPDRATTETPLPPS